MRKVMFFTLFAFFLCVGILKADIVRLKRGISFEGRLIEEKSDVYVFEMDLGVVTFDKTEVDSLEVYSDADNKEMLEEWELTSAQDSDSVSGEMLSFEQQPKRENSSRSKDAPAEGLVRYKGRYVTPEVYAIIEKERAIRERRQQFIHQQRIEAEHDKEIQKQKDALLKGVPEQVEVSETSQVKEVADFSSIGDKFGSEAESLSRNSKSSRHKNPFGSKGIDYGSSI